MSSAILRLVNPWKYKREAVEAAQVVELRARDGDECRRCRRPMRFDLPPGHDQGAAVQQILFDADAAADTLDNLCLTHRRCHGETADTTREVTERIRRKNEAELFVKARKRA